MLICHSLLQYQMDFPFYFKASLDKINIDFKNRPFLEEEKKTFDVGEEINKNLSIFIKEGIALNDLRSDIKIKPVIFSIWSMLSGIIQTSCVKEQYILQELDMTRIEFLDNGFDMLYKSIKTERDSDKNES